jgi:hypothetical protein
MKAGEKKPLTLFRSYVRHFNVSDGLSIETNPNPPTYWQFLASVVVSAFDPQS